MLHRFRFPTLLALAVAFIALALVSSGGAGAAGPPDGNGLDHAIAVQDARTDELLTKPGVVGTAVGLNADGQPVVVIYTVAAGVPGLPTSLDGVPVAVRVTGRFFAFAPPPLDANFTFTCSGLTCDFDASSTTGKGKKTYSWDFGDGDTGSGQNVTHTYGASGTYTVTLTVTDKDGGTDSETQDVTVTSGGGGDTDCTVTGDTAVRCERPVPIGVSTGHPNITAGTIGARVTDGTDVFALSNNHIYADQNDALIGDSALQPGPIDGGQDPIDAIGTLAAFEPILFDGSDNTMDAAIALSSTTDLGNSTPSNGYGTPSSTTVSATLDLAVQKYGRTTSLTTGTVSEINVTVNVCYEGFVVCTKSARFVDQMAIEGTEDPGDFSAGGDSGSLVLTQAGNNPVGLLFAGSSTRTIANRIDLVLSRFTVTIDDTAPAPVATGSIAGTVTNFADGTAIGGATVSTDTGQSAVTGADGTYTITDVPTGDRSVTASAAGFESQTKPATVTENQTTTAVDFALSAATTASKVIVDSITYATEGGKNQDKHLLIAVALKDDLGNTVSGASVSIDLSRDGSFVASGTGTTGTDGTVTFTLRNASSGCYTTTVTDVTAAGLTWDGLTPANQFGKGATCP